MYLICLRSALSDIRKSGQGNVHTRQANNAIIQCFYLYDLLSLLGKSDAFVTKSALEWFMDNIIFIWVIQNPNLAGPRVPVTQLWSLQVKPYDARTPGLRMAFSSPAAFISAISALRSSMARTSIHSQVFKRLLKFQKIRSSVGYECMDAFPVSRP